MQYALVVAAAALAHAHQHNHDRFHRREIEVVTAYDVEYVTDTVIVTAGVEPSAYSAPPYTTCTTPSSSSTSTTPAPTAWSTPSSSNSQRTTFSTAVSPVAYVAASSPPAAHSSSPTTSSAPTSYSSSSLSSGITTNNLTPNGKKAGLSGFAGCQEKSAFTQLAPHIGWYSDYTPNTPDAHGVKGIGMLWGGSGSSCGSTEKTRLDTFTSMISANKVPEIMFGFYEPDCSCPDSAGMSTSSAASDWNSLIAPLKKKGTVLGSPSLCKQKDEHFFGPFKKGISTDWDVTSIHVNKPNLAGAQSVVEYYYNTYGKPIWVSEFACVNDQPSWSPCTDQTQIDTFIKDVVNYFQNNPHVVAYGPSNGNGLGNVWPLTDSSGALTHSGKTYLSAIQNL